MLDNPFITIGIALIGCLIFAFIIREACSVKKQLKNQETIISLLERILEK